MRTIKNTDSELTSVLPRRLTTASKWLRSGVEVCQNPAYAISLDVDMSGAHSLIELARANSFRVTYTHVFVRAAALALAAAPELHKMICGSRIHTPDHVDIALSVAGDSAASPLLVLSSAEERDILSIGAEITMRAPEVRDADRRLNAALCRWGWLIPTNFLRKTLLRALFQNVNFRRQGAGTFQVSVMPGVDRMTTPVFSSSATLLAGKVSERVVALNGAPAVRPMATLTCCADHRVWDGNAGQKFLASVSSILESSLLLDELIKAIELRRNNLPELAVSAN